MKKTLMLVLTVALILAMATTLAGCQRKVKVLTGEMVICTAGEILEDNTEEVEVPEDEVEQYGVTTKVITCDEHSDLGTLYGEAQEAIAIGDLVVARERLNTILQRDPNYRKAKEQLDAIDAGRSPEADPGDETADNEDPATTPDEPDAQEPTGPVVSLTKYVPDSISGYVAQAVLADAASLSRMYLPTADSADQLVIEVEQRVNDAAAVTAQKEIVGGYPNSQSTKTINGRSVMVGVYGKYAIAVFTDGALTVSVEIHGTGASGTSVMDATVAVVTAITQ